MQGVVDSEQGVDLIVALLVWKTLRRVMLQNLYFSKGYTDQGAG